MFLMGGDGTPYDILYSLLGGHAVLYPVGVLVLFLMIAGRMAPILFGGVPVLLTIVDVIGWIITLWVVAITIWSGVDYFRKNFDVIRNAK